MIHLKHVRERAGLSVAQLARLVGVSRDTVYRWERGDRRISDEHLGRLVRVLMLNREKDDG